MAWGELLDGRCWLRTLQGVDEFLGGMYGCVGGRDGWNFAHVREKISGTSDSDAVGVRDLELVAPVMLERRAEVPCFFSMWGPTEARLRLFIDQRPCVRWSEGGSVEIELTEELRIG